MVRAIQNAKGVYIMAKANKVAATVTENNAPVVAPNNTPVLQAGVAVHTGKYTATTAKLGGAGAIPAFKYSAMQLTCNTAPNTAPQKPTSVMGKIYALVKAQGPAGVTGAQLVELMLAADWQGHPSAYVAGGKVCAAWCVGYIVGACSNKHKHLLAAPAKV